jgi:hypothetical protein
MKDMPEGIARRSVEEIRRSLAELDFKLEGKQ